MLPVTNSGKSQDGLKFEGSVSSKSRSSHPVKTPYPAPTPAPLPLPLFVAGIKHCSTLSRSESASTTPAWLRVTGALWRRCLNRGRFRCATGACCLLACNTSMGVPLLLSYVHAAISFYSNDDNSSCARGDSVTWNTIYLYSCATAVIIRACRDHISQQRRQQQQQQANEGRFRYLGIRYILYPCATPGIIRACRNDNILYSNDSNENNNSNNNNDNNNENNNEYININNNNETNDIRATETTTHHAGHLFMSLQVTVATTKPTT